MASPLLHFGSPELASSDEDPPEIQQQRPGSRFLRGGYLVAVVTLLIAVVTLCVVRANGKLRGTSTLDFQQKTGDMTDHACVGEPDLMCEELILPDGVGVIKWECRNNMAYQCPTPVCTDGCGCGCETTETTSISSFSSTSVTTVTTTTASATTVTSTTASATSVTSTITTETVTTTTMFHRLKLLGTSRCLTYNLNLSTAMGFVCFGTTLGQTGSWFDLQPGDGHNFVYQRWDYDTSSQQLSSPAPGYQTKCLQVGGPLNDQGTFFATAMVECGIIDTQKWIFGTSGAHHIEPVSKPGWCLYLDQGWGDAEDNIHVQNCSDDSSEAWTWV